MKRSNRIFLILGGLLLVFFLSLFLLFKTPSPVGVTGSVPGIWKGTLQVDYHGAAVYTLKPFITPGIKNRNPRLRFVYNSRTGNGELGRGFQLYGISSISRCPDSRPLDEACVTKDCAWCLDGAQLIQVAPGEYRTEKESWSKILLTGTPGTSDTSQALRWVVIDKDGNHLEYGRTDNGRIYSQGTDSIWRFMISRRTDRNGNYVGYRYLNTSQSDGAFYPEAIYYTGNDSFATPIKSNRRVLFNYENRDDVLFHYQYGSSITKNKRLSSMDAQVNAGSGWETVWTYGFDYENTGANLQSRVTGISWFDASGNFIGPVSFDWQTGSNALDAEANQGTGGVDSARYTWTDFNNDGQLDLMIDQTISPYYHYVRLSENNGLGSPLLLTAFGSEGADYTWADVNGDGYSDLLVDEHIQGQTASRHYGFLSTGTGLGQQLNFPAYGPWYAKFIWTDFNKDGRVDLTVNLDTLSYEHWVLISQGTSLANATYLGALGAGTGESVWADFNADGRSDLVFDQTASPYNHWVRLSNGSSLDPAQLLGTFGTPNARFTWADVNGDKLPDLIQDVINNTVNSYQHFVKLNTGMGLIAGQYSFGTFGLANANYTWQDFNMDGMADLLVDQNTNSTTDQHALQLSAGTSMQSGTISFGTFGGANTIFIWTDVNGDGLPDLTSQETASPYQSKIRYHSGSYPNLVTTIQNTVGGVESLEYSALPEYLNYAETGSPEYPKRYSSPPLYVVTSQSFNDGRENPNTYNFEYQYQNSVYDLDGRGWLGFGGVVARDLQLGNLNETTYFQDYPLTGLVDQKEVRDFENQRLNLHLNQYDVQADNGIYVVNRTGQTLAFYGSKGESYAIQKQYGFDEYGNAIFVWDRGDTTTTSDDIYTCFSNINDTSLWVLGLPVKSWVGSAGTYSNGTCSCDSSLRKGWLTYSTDGRYNLRTRTRWDDQLNFWYGRTYYHDGFGHDTLLVDPENGEETRSFETTWNTYPLQQTNAKGQTETYVYDGRIGRVLEHTDANQNKYYTEWDGFARSLKYYVPDPGSTTGDTLLYKSHVFGETSGSATAKYMETVYHRVEWDNSNQATWLMENVYLDGLARKWRSEHVNPLSGARIRKDMTFNNSAQIEFESLSYYDGGFIPLNQMNYDKQGRVDFSRHPDSSESTVQRFVTESASAPAPNLNWMISGSNSSMADTLISYTNARGKVVRQIYAKGGSEGGGVTDLSYDRLNRRKKVVLPKQVRTSYAYSTLDQITEIDDSQTGSLQYFFNKRSLLDYEIDALNDTTWFSYDTLGRMLTRRTADHLTTFTYDNDQENEEITNGIGQLTQLVYEDLNTNLRLTYEFAYDPFGEATRTWMDFGGRTFVETDSFNAQRHPILHVYPDNSISISAFDPFGFMDSLACADQGGAGPTSMTTYIRLSNYSAMGRYGLALYNNGTSEKMVYNTAEKLDSVQVRLGNDSLVLSWVYGYNDKGMLSSVRDLNLPDYSQTFSYYRGNYLASATCEGIYGTLNYDYDSTGNITLKDSIRYVSEGQQVIAGLDQAGDTVFAASYDAVGSMTSMKNAAGTFSFTYDASYRLTRIQLNGVTQYEYLYNHLGIRVAKLDYTTGVRSFYPLPGYIETWFGDTLYQWSKQLGGGSGQVVLTSDRRTPGGEAITWVRQFGGGTGNDENADPYAGIPNPGRQYHHFDQVSSVSVVTDASGDLVNKVYYKPYGEMAMLEGQNRFRAKFSGKEYEEGAGLYYFNSRFYNPVIGKFITADNRLIGGSLNVIAAYNRYAYAGNNPITNVDPSGSTFLGMGHDWWKQMLVGMALGAMGLDGYYYGGAAVNHNLNPLKWNWKSPKTYLGMVAGFLISEAGSVINELLGGNVLGAAVSGAFENAAYTALAGGSPKQIMEQALNGAAMGAMVALAMDLMDMGEEEEEDPEMVDAIDVGATEGSWIEMSSLPKKEPEDTEVEFQGCACFDGATMVETRSGKKPLEEIELSEEVRGLDVASGKQGWFPVTALFERERDSMITVTVEGELIRTTTDHPFYVEDHGWIAARDLEPDDCLVTLHGNGVCVQEVRPEAKRWMVRNIEVRGAHTYYVAETGVLVHNTKCVQGGPPLTRNRRKVLKKKYKIKIVEVLEPRVRRPTFIFGMSRPITRFGPTVGGLRMIDFGYRAVDSYSIPLTGSYATDFANLDALYLARHGRARPGGHTWHHVDYSGATPTGGFGVGRMQLVPTRVHNNHAHYGGASQFRAAHGTAYY